MNDSKDQPEPTMEEILASIRRIISEDGQPTAERDPQADRAEAGNDDVLELTQVVEDDAAVEKPVSGTSSQDDIDNIMNDSVNSEAPVTDAPRNGATGATSDRRTDPGPEANAPPSSSKPPDADEAIVSADAAAASTAAFASLASALDGRQPLGGDIPIGAGGRTLEDIVRELLRPMLKEWLDANLPQIVERLVQREVERMARRAEDR